jgi:hypothetical protein
VVGESVCLWGGGKRWDVCLLCAVCERGDGVI